ncbi:diaminopimelate decarboxylase [Armatimonas rosea]|uniref:Diaminopimelate decarboxylase n=1 Tax=Armatimonas rosea TaxID=685828 RepID=A0A7W9SQT4_ARMRO|nr:diaminopimelate decarboxylase [Armatimonas rosea]MBB6051112.1 diaminopimelate decarboxylase [Armatimonas rosea]
MLLGTQKINAQGHLEIGGCDTLALAAEFGTPLYVMDEALVRENCRRFTQVFTDRYPGEVEVSFAGKAFLTMAMVRLVQQEGLALDVASGGELYTALKAGFPAEKILYHGNFKSDEELAMGVAAGVGRFVVDNPYELKRLSELAAAQGKTQAILLRVTPGIDPHTHAKISTGQEDSKFGISVSSGLALATVQEALSLPGIDFKGIHCHIGSQLLDSHTHEDAAEIMVGFVAAIREATGFVCTDLDIGGGLGVRYLPSHNPPSYEEFADSVVSAVVGALEKHALPFPRLMLEPGRALVAEAGTTLYTVGPIKKIELAERTKTFVSVDGGLSDNPRPVMYDARYSVLVAGRAAQATDTTVTVSGKHCETDLLFPELALGEVHSGDILAVQTTGAYNHGMASNYNRFRRPAVVFVHDGQADVVWERESYDDLLRQERLPQRFLEE